MLVIIFLIIVLVAMNDEGSSELNSIATATANPVASESPTSVPQPTARPPQPTVTPQSKFNCRELELEFNNMMVIDYNTALMHVSNVMTMKDSDLLAYYTSGDAERELQNCGVIPR